MFISYSQILFLEHNSSDIQCRNFCQRNVIYIHVSAFDSPYFIDCLLKSSTISIFLCSVLISCTSPFIFHNFQVHLYLVPMISTYS